MKRHIGVAAVVVGLLATSAAPARSAVSDWAAAGVVTGTLVYDGMPGYLKTCRRDVPFDLSLDSPAVAFRTSTGVYVTSLAIRAIGAKSGSRNCSSQSAASAQFEVEIRAGDLQCDSARASYIKIVSELQMIIAASSCRFADGPAPQSGWLFELAYEDGRLAGVFEMGA